MADPLPARRGVTAGIAASPEDVWRFVSDPSVPARFSPELQAAHVDGGGAATLGAVIVGRNARAGNEWTTHSRVVACEPPSRFAWDTGDPPGASWSFEVSPAPGGSSLRFEVVLHAGREPLASAMQRDPANAEAIVEGRLTELLGGMAATVEGIAALAEGRDPDGPLPAA